MGTTNLTSLRLDNFNFWILLLSQSVWNSCFWISAWQSARICSLYRSRRILICSFFWAAARNFSNTWNLWIKRFHNGSLRSIMTGGRRQTKRWTFFLRVTNLSTARCIFSLLTQWWKGRSVDGVVIDLQVLEVWGPAVAGGLLDEDFSGLWDLVAVDEVGLITCERCVVDQKVRLFCHETHKGFISESTKLRRWNERSRRCIGKWLRQMKSAKEGSKRQAHDTWVV